MKKIKHTDVKVRDYVTLGEINHGTGGPHKTLKDKQRNRKSKVSQREKNKLRMFCY